MIYDIINIFDAVLAVLAIIVWIDIVAMTRKKTFVPHRVRRWQIAAVYSFLAMSGFAFGYVLNGLINNEYNSTYTVLTKIICYIVWLGGSYYTWMISKEREVIMRHEEATHLYTKENMQ